MLDNQQVPQNIIDKLVSLMKLKNNEGASPAEAENAAMRIQEILLRYNLEMSQVEDATHSKDAKHQINRDDFDLNNLQKKTESDWVEKLYRVIAKHNLCYAIGDGTPKRYRKHKYDQGIITLVGKPHNIEITKYTVEVLLPMIRAAEKNAFNEYDGEEKRNTFKRGFFRGCVDGIDSKLVRNAQELEKLPENTGMALMVVEQRQEVVAWVKSNIKIKMSKASSISSSSGRELGYEAGQRMKVGSGLGNSTSNQKRLN